MAIKIITLGNATLYHGDCMEIMPQLQGNIDAVITDPPYGLGKKLLGGASNANWKKLCEKVTQWDILCQDIIDYIVVHYQIAVIWGGNYYDLPPSRCFFVWDKGKTMRGLTFAECEMAWVSLDRNARIINLGMPTHKGQEKKVHPTKKPLELMKWCIQCLPKEIDLILDPFMGSGTTGVATLQMGKKFIGIEKDPEYFDTALERIKNAKRQPDLFVDQPKKEQTTLF